MTDELRKPTDEDGARDVPPAENTGDARSDVAADADLAGASQGAEADPTDAMVELPVDAEVVAAIRAAQKSRGIEVPPANEFGNPLADFSVLVGPQFSTPVFSVAPLLPPSAPPASFWGDSSSGHRSEEHVTIGDLVGRPGDPVTIERLPYRYGQEAGGMRIEKIAARRDEGGASSAENVAANDTPSSTDSASSVDTEDETDPYQPLGMALPILYVKVDDERALIASELSAHAEQMRELSRQISKEEVRYAEWVRHTEERRLGRD